MTIQKTILILIFSLEPIALGIQPDPASTDASKSPLNIGFLDVTKAPYHADPKGRKDSVEAINRAVADARDQRLVCFFPEGTYRISDSIIGRMRNIKYEPCILVGSTKGKRPLIKLNKGAKHFQDPNNPRPAVWLFWVAPHDTYNGPHEFVKEKTSASFNQSIKGIDIDISGNPGAIGVRNAGSQGCTLEDITVFANGAFAGVNDPPGQGGGAYNLKVIGGEYGIWITRECRFPMINGLTLKDQTKAAINYHHGMPIVITAFNIIKDRPPIIANHKSSTGITLVDGSIELQEKGVLCASDKKESIYMKNVYLKGISKVTGSSNTENISNIDNWTRINEYASCKQGALNCIDGEISSLPEICNKDTPVTKPKSQKIQALHLWNKNQIPSFEDNDVVNIKDLGAKGDGISDDTEVFKKAIAQHRKVFLPKGEYIVSKSIVLGEHTQLFGVSRLYSTIQTAPGWGSAGTPVVTTVNSENAAPFLGSLSIVITEPHFSAIRWMSGRNSIVRNVHAAAKTHRSNSPTSIFTITGNGGGKWFAVNGYGALGKMSSHPDYRIFLIQETKEPLNIYALNAERLLADAQSEIVDSKNVRLFYFKSEALSHAKSTPFRIKHSKNIEFYGMAGNISLDQGKPLLEIIDSNNITASHISSWRGTPEFNTIKEQHSGKTVTLSATNPLALFKRTN